MCRNIKGQLLQCLAVTRAQGSRYFATHCTAMPCPQTLAMFCRPLAPHLRNWTLRCKLYSPRTDWAGAVWHQALHGQKPRCRHRKDLQAPGTWSDLPATPHPQPSSQAPCLLTFPSLFPPSLTFASLGYHVDWGNIPRSITAMNRCIIATLP